MARSESSLLTPEGVLEETKTATCFHDFSISFKQMANLGKGKKLPPEMIKALNTVADLYDERVNKTISLTEKTEISISDRHKIDRLYSDDFVTNPAAFNSDLSDISRTLDRVQKRTYQSSKSTKEKLKEAVDTSVIQSIVGGQWFGQKKSAKDDKER